MKTLFSTHHTHKTDIALLIVRVAVGVWMLTKGIPKISMLSADPLMFPSVMGMSPMLSLCLTLFAEVLCSFLLLIGLGTRFATIPLIIVMLVAVGIIHSGDPMAKKEPALHFLLIYVILFFTGAGKYSVDYKIHRKQPEPENRRTEGL